MATMLFKLALLSLKDRKNSVLLSVLAMTVSIVVLIGIEHIRQQTKANFANTISGVDLIVGARTSSMNLLLYSVFRIGNPTNNIRWDTYQAIANSKQVKWAIPISLGDSHKGFRVMGTTPEYFDFFSYGQKHGLTFKAGARFNHVFDVVLGADVANKLGYRLGDKITLAHGIGATSFSHHSANPFTVSGILARTGTPVDQTLHVSLQSIEAIHSSGPQTVQLSEALSLKDVQDDPSLQPKTITAFMVGLQSKMAIFQFQRRVNEYASEPIVAILPGVALSELWQMMGMLENTLLLISVLVFIAASFGVSAMLLTSIRERRHEINLLRMIGAPAYFLFLLIQVEALLITLLSCGLGLSLLSTCLWLFGDELVSQFGLNIAANLLTLNTLYVTMATMIASVLIAIIPSLTGYRHAKQLNN